MRKTKTRQGRKKGKTYLVVFADGGQDPEAKAANMKPR